MKKSENRFLVATGIALGIAISAVGVGLGWYFGIEKPKESTTSSQPAPAPTSSGNSGATVASENGIKVNVRTLLSETNAVTYDATYSVSPTDYTGEVGAKIEWSDSAVTDTISQFLTINHDKANKKVTVTLVKAFQHQAKLTIFSVETPTINAVVTIDYNNRVNTYSNDKASGLTTISSDMPTMTVGYTEMAQAGSLPFSETLTFVSANWNSNFINAWGYQADSNPSTDYIAETKVPITSAKLSLATSTTSGHVNDIKMDTSLINASFLRNMSLQLSGDDYTDYRKFSDLTKTEMTNVLNNPIIDVKYKTNFTNANTADSGEVTAEIYASPDYIAEPISSITAGHTSYVF